MTGNGIFIKGTAAMLLAGGAAYGLGSLAKSQMDNDVPGDEPKLNRSQQRELMIAHALVDFDHDGDGAIQYARRGKDLLKDESLTWYYRSDRDATAFTGYDRMRSADTADTPGVLDRGELNALADRALADKSYVRSITNGHTTAFPDWILGGADAVEAARMTDGTQTDLRGS